MKNSRLTLLLEKYADGQLNAEERQELESMLLASESAREQFWEEMTLHGLTHEVVELKWSGQSLPARRRWLPESLAGFLDWRPSFRWGLGLAAALAVSFIATGLWSSLRHPPVAGVTSIARLAQVRGPVFIAREGREIETEEGMPLRAGDRISVTLGANSLVRLADATEFRLAGGSTFVLRGPEGKEIYLESGSLAAQVVKQKSDRQVIIHTPLATVTVHGTSFDLDAATGETRLDVREGWVRMAHSQRESEVDLTGGEFAVARPGSEILACLHAPIVRETKVADLPGQRAVAQWPFASSSPWNTSLGSGAVYVDLVAPALDLPHHGAAVQPAALDRPLFIARADDPDVTVFRRYSPGEITRLKLPTSALRGSARLTDFTVISPDGHTANEIVQAAWSGEKLQAVFCYTSDLRGSGVPPLQIGHTFSGLPLAAGIIRRGEFDQGIPHALAATVLHSALSRAGPNGHAFVWPARHWPIESKLISEMAASGNLHFGVLLAIPPDVDITNLGVGKSGPAFEIARALQDYGAYVTQSYGPVPSENQRGWVQPHIQFFADGLTDQEARLLIPSVSMLVPHLKLVANNTPENIGGGGAPRRPRAPEISSK